MGTPVVRFQNRDGLVSWGRLEPEGVRPIPGPAESLSAFLTKQAWKQQPARDALPLEEVSLLSPVTAPCQIICQGKNYLEHMVETGVRPGSKDFNTLFAKADSSLAPPVGEVVRPKGVRLLDYELELGLVIGSSLRSYRKVTESSLHELVAGIVMGNDLSARDIQVPQRQWFKGKSFRGFCPVGPVLYLLDPEDFPRIYELDLELTVNGKRQQKASTRQLLHRPEDTLTEISGIFDLRPGDLLLTGTPGGVAMRVKPKGLLGELRGAFRGDREKFAAFVEEQALSPRYLQDGDLIESTIRSADGVVDLGARGSWCEENKKGGESLLRLLHRLAVFLTSGRVRRVRHGRVRRHRRRRSRHRRHVRRRSHPHGAPGGELPRCSGDDHPSPVRSAFRWHWLLLDQKPFLRIRSLCCGPNRGP
jgi:2,4-didehydro-3-deoxy-L-rhamnonate hydrolase